MTFITPLNNATIISKYNIVTFKMSLTTFQDQITCLKDNYKNEYKIKED